MYASNKHYDNLVKNELKTRITMIEFASYLHVELTNEKLQEEDVEVKLAMTIRTPKEVLREFTSNSILRNSYAEKLDMNCYLVDRDPKHYTNNYPNMLSIIANNLLHRYKLTQEDIIRKTHVEPKGVVRVDSTVYAIFEVFVLDKDLINLPIDCWEDIKTLKNDFKNLSILDTILIENLRTKETQK